nr:hypothetical protein [Candidatus Njordarchaeota archaeon]
MDYSNGERIVALVGLALAGLLLLCPHVMEGSWLSDVKPLLIWVMTFSSLIMLVFPPPQPQRKRSELSERKRDEGGEIEMLVSVACYRGSCGHGYRRLFQRGDYVRKMVSRCPACGGELYVKAIYAVEEKRR